MVVSAPAREALAAADDLLVSVVSYAEVGIKASVGKLDLPDGLQARITDSGVRTLGLSPTHLSGGLRPSGASPRPVRQADRRVGAGRTPDSCHRGRSFPRVRDRVAQGMNATQTGDIARLEYRHKGRLMMEVGVRELRDGLSRHLAIVRDGHTITVTDHGRPVARIIPIGVPTKLEQLIAAGKVTPAKRQKGARPSPIATSGVVSDLVTKQRR